MKFRWFGWFRKRKPPRNATNGSAATRVVDGIDYETLEVTESITTTALNKFFKQPEDSEDKLPDGSDDDEDDDLIVIEGTSDILTKKEIKHLSLKLPARLLCCSWKKVFYSSRDGFSLGTLYRILHSHLSRPAVLLIRDMEGHRFGAFVAEAFRICEKSYGCGETFVFSLNKVLQVWKWTGKNNFFILCSSRSLCIGIDDGKFAICLDETLDRGRSQPCETFDNEPLCPAGDFHVAEIEVWIFE